MRNSSKENKAPAAEADWEERYRALAEKSRIGVGILQDKTFVFANQALADIFGCSIEEVMAAGLEEWADEEYRSNLAHQLSQVTAETPLPLPLQFRARRNDGSAVTVQVCSVVVTILSGREALLLNARDVSQEDAQHQILSSNEKRFRSIFENAVLGIFQSKVDGRIIDFNPFFAKMLGYESAQELREAAGGLAQNIYADSAQREHILATLLSQHSMQTFEVHLRRKDQSVMTGIMHIWSSRNEDGEIDHLEGFVEDITERRRAEEERRKLERQMLNAQKMESLGVLAGGIAHDFNNLLMGILGNANLALLDLAPSAPARENLLQIESAAKRSAELCRQMLAYSGKGRFVIQSIDLSQLIQDMDNLLRVTVPKNIVLKLNLERSLPHIEADASQLRQVMINLMNNAAEAIGERSGIVTVCTGATRCDHDYLSSAFLHDEIPEGDYVYLEVSDTGCGMSEDVISRSFDPFFSTKFPGRGLGLAAVLGIVRGHHGAIKIYSEIGRGTSFKVLFPCQDEGLGDEANEDAAAWRGQGTILVVDDEETVCVVTRQMLERAGFEVVTAGDGAEALEAYDGRAEEIVLVMLDMTMPNMDGVETFRRLRQINKDIKVVLSSGYNEQEATSRFAGKGLAGFIQKPYGVKELIRTVREALEG